MSVNTVANIVLIAAAVIWILWRQIQAAPIKTRLLVAAPLVMGYFGIRGTPSSTWSSAADVGLILIGAVFGIALGLARGATIRVWRERDGLLWRQGSKLTLLLWGALLVVRVVMAGIAQATGHHAATGLGPIMLSLALSFAAQNAVTGLRMSALGVDGGAGAAAGPSAAWAAEDDVPTSGRTTSAAPRTSAVPVLSRYEAHEQRRADRHARRATRREQRRDRW